MELIKLLVKVILIIKIFQVESRQLQTLQLYTDDERCNELGECADMDYFDKNLMVSFTHRPHISFNANSSYEVEERKEFMSMTFSKSKFWNFPLNLFKAFDVKELDFRNCSLRYMKVESFLNACQLSVLLLDDNRLTRLHAKQFSKARQLTFLTLANNHLNSLHHDSFKGLKKLNYLDLHQNFIESLDSKIFIYLEKLQQLNLAENRLKLIQEDLFLQNRQLFSVQMQSNSLLEIQDYAFEKQNLKFLDFSFNPELQTFVSTNLKVNILKATNCALERVNIYGEALHLDFQHNKIKELYFSKPELLETLILKDNALEQISTLEHALNMKILDISNNPQLKSLSDLWKINSLEKLDASNISLREIPEFLFVNPHKLKYLNISFNKIEEIDPKNAKGLEKLSEFYIHHNNWNCFILKLLMERLIKRHKISYTQDQYERNFPGKYIDGIKCMRRSEKSSEEYSNIQEQNDQEPYINPVNQQNNFDNIENVTELREVFKAAIGKNEQKFSLIIEKLNDLDERLKTFERLNNNTKLWQQASIVV